MKIITKKSLIFEKLIGNIIMLPIFNNGHIKLSKIKNIKYEFINDIKTEVKTINALLLT